MSGHFTFGHCVSTPIDIYIRVPTFLRRDRHLGTVYDVAHNNSKELDNSQ